MNLNHLTIKQASWGLRNKKFLASELISDCLDEIKKMDSQIHAYLDVFEDPYDQAKKADEMLSSNHNLPPLFGIPIAVKDNILIKDKKCTAGSKILANYIASFDATVISKLKNQGAIFIGKTNLDEFAMGSSTENSNFGPSKNPHDMARVPGGSSGGSSAAVSANMCMAALGSDTGGSIRQPASFCGIVGMKPTYGRVSRHGLIAMASSLDQIGLMTKTVEDAKILFDAISGEDNFDATTTNENLEFRTSNLELAENLADFRVGVPREYFAAGLNQEVEKIIKSGLKKIEDAGAKIEEINLPHTEYALPAYYIVVPSEVSSNLARYDGIRYGLSSSAESLGQVYNKTRAWGFGDEVKRRVMLGTYVLSAGYYDAYYLKAQKVRQIIKQDFKKAFEKVDIIIGPTTPTPAFKLGEKGDDPLKMYMADSYTVAVNLAGLPAISLPAGFVELENKKLPVGMQIIGRWHEDEKMLMAAEEIEKIL